ncbi:semaphorin-4D-like [Glandiceps talaboti]
MTMKMIMIKVAVLSLCLSLVNGVEYNNVVEYTEIKAYVNDTGVRYYKSLYLDDGNLYMGAVNSETNKGVVIKVNADDISDPYSRDEERIEFEVEVNPTLLCNVSTQEPEKVCKNYIRVVESDPSSSNLLVCGTNAQNPKCYHVAKDLSSKSDSFDGKKKCPKLPDDYVVAKFGTDNALYAATLSGAGSYVIARFTNSDDSDSELETEGDTKWQLEPEYIDMYQYTASGGVPQMLVFFRETANENTDLYPKELTYARIAKVCEKDKGGSANILTNKWTSYLKARLACYDNGGTSEYQQFYDILEDTFLIGEVVYGVFTSSKNGVTQSAMCSFSLSKSDMDNVFDAGTYWYQERAGEKWNTETPGLTPKPGECIDNSNVGTGNEAVYRALRNHPLTSELYNFQEDMPQLTSFSGIKFTHISGIKVDGTGYTLLYIGTDRGTVIKALHYNNEAVTIDEIMVSAEKAPISVMTISSMFLYVGFDDKVVQLPLYQCNHHSRCDDCVAARDPHCAWNGDECVHIDQGGSNPKQDVVNGDASVCVETPATSFSVEETGADIIVSCFVRGVKWFKDGEELMVHHGAKYIAVDGLGLTVTQVTTTDSGEYKCTNDDSSVTYSQTTVSVKPPLISATPEFLEPNLAGQAFTVVKDKPFVLYCRASGPNDMTLKWYDGDGNELDAVLDVLFTTTHELFSTLSTTTDIEKTYICKLNDDDTKKSQVTIAVEDTLSEEHINESLNWDVKYYEYGKKVKVWESTADVCKDSNGNSVTKPETCPSCQCGASTVP